MNPAAIVKMLDEKVDSVLSTVNEKLAAIKSDIAITAKVCPEVTVTQPRYSDILKNNTQPASIIQPKNLEQPPSQTKSDILQQINPSQSNIQLSKVKNLKNGGILIGCKNREDNAKF